MKDYTALTLKHEVEFNTIFGVRLRDYMRSCMGFDLLKFDATVVKPEDGVSTKDTIERKYGKRGVELVSILF